MRGPGRPLGHDLRLVEADREVRGRHLARCAEQLGQADREALPGQVVQRDVEGALGRPVVADRVGHRLVGRGEPGSGRPQLIGYRTERHEGLQEQRQDGLHRADRLAVERVGEALAKGRCAARIGELHDHRRGVAVLERPGDAEPDP